MSDGSVLITGASTGIGEAIALRFGRRGWQVYAGVRREEDGARLRDSSGGLVQPVRIDVADEESVRSCLEEISSLVGPAGLTAVVNNAGIAIGGPVEHVTLDEWRRQFEVNVFGQVAVTQAAMPLLRMAGDRGRIVFIGSIGGRVASPFVGPYSASKHAIEAIAESMRHELEGTGLRVVVIEPGAVSTPMWDKGQTAADEIEARLPETGRLYYGSQVRDLRKVMAAQARSGVDPDVVARVVETAVTSSRPSARYLVGRDAKVMAAVARVLPDRARDASLRRALSYLSR
jgi:NAD(P)-dependent dehydrogenase (short-subunit alcohol dehydrogenase family)